MKSFIVLALSAVVSAVKLDASIWPMPVQSQQQAQAQSQQGSGWFPGNIQSQMQMQAQNQGGWPASQNQMQAQAQQQQGGGNQSQAQAQQQSQFNTMPWVYAQVEEAVNQQDNQATKQADQQEQQLTDEQRQQLAQFFLQMTDRRSLEQFLNQAFLQGYNSGVQDARFDVLKSVQFQAYQAGYAQAQQDISDQLLAAQNSQNQQRTPGAAAQQSSTQQSTSVAENQSTHAVDIRQQITPGTTHTVIPQQVTVGDSKLNQQTTVGASAQQHQDTSVDAQALTPRVVDTTTGVAGNTQKQLAVDVQTQ